MSKEFEELVLEKLNSINDFQKEVTIRLDKIDKTLDEHTRILDEHTKVLNEHTRTLDEHTELLNEHTKILNQHSKQIQKNTEEIQGLSEVVIYHNNTLIKMEHEIGNKIDTLFDAYKINHEEYMSNFKSILSLKEQIFKHEIRISNLENLSRKNSKLLAL